MPRAAATWVVIMMAALAGCVPRDRPATTPVATATQVVRPDPRGVAYDGDVQAIAKGKLYYRWYNCDGCHANGGGAIGPALMDQRWIYGGRIDQVHNSIAEGRRNGMPAWARKIPDEQIWQIAAYVRSLSAPSTINRGKARPDSPPPPVANHPPAAG